MTTLTDARKSALVKAIHCSVLWRAFYRNDREVYEKMLESHYGVRSSTAMNIAQLADLLNYMNNKQAHPSRIISGTPPGGRKNGKVAAIASPAEHKKIAALSGLIRWKYEDGLERWMQKRFRIRRVKTKAQAFRVIEGMKQMFEHQMQADYGPDWRTLQHDDPGIIEYIRRHR